METQWKDIMGYEGLYRISNFGDVLLLKREWITGWGKGVKVCRPERLARKSIKKSTGYYAVTLTKNSKQKQYEIHRLVAEHFLPNPQNKRTVNHIDGNKLNNNISNLEWATYSENASHAFRTKLRNQNGDRNPFAVKVKIFVNGIKLGEWGNIKSASIETGISKHNLYHKSKFIKGRHKEIHINK